MDKNSVIVDLPLLDQLLALDDEIRRRFPPSDHRRFEDEGLMVLGTSFWKPRTLGSWGYSYEPVNCSVLGGTGGNAVHFNILARDYRIDESCPVYVVVPAALRGGTIVVADSFTNFLRFGIRRGFFALEELAYHLDLVLQAYSSADWHPTEDWHYSVGFGQRERERQVLDFVRDRLKLEPLEYTRQEFDALQEKYLPLLEFTKKSND